MMKESPMNTPGQSIRRPRSLTAFLSLLPFFLVSSLLPLSSVLAGEPGAVGDLYVSSFSTSNVVQFDGQTGDLVGEFVPQGSGELDGATGLTFVPNGNLFVCSRETFNVKEFDGQTGTFVGDLTPPCLPDGGRNPEAGWPEDTYDLAFRSDGRLLVAVDITDAVLSYSAATGEWLGTFAIGGGEPGGLDGPLSLASGPNGNVFVASAFTDEVLEYHGTTGRLERVFASGGGVSGPNGVTFGPNGNLFVTNFFTDSVIELDGRTGAFLGTFASGGGLSAPRDLTFGPNGNLFVSGKINGNDGVIEYDGTTGAVIGTFATSALLSNAWGLVFKPAPPEAMPAPTISNVSVSELDACEPVSAVTVAGTDLNPTSTLVKLTATGKVDVVGVVTGGTANELQVEFDLGTGIPGGMRDVVVVNPDGQMDMLPSAIEVAACYTATEENLLVLGDRHRAVTRHGLFEYDGASGDLIGFVVEDKSGSAGDDLGQSTGFAFGHNGNLLVTSWNPGDGSVLEYDGITGRKLGTFIPAGTGGMLVPERLAFGPNGNLFVLHRNTSCSASGVLEFDGLTGAFVRDFVPLGTCGLACGGDLEFGGPPDWHLYVTDTVRPMDGPSGGVYFFDGQTGACLSGGQLILPPLASFRSRALEFSPHNANLVLPWWSPSGQGRVTEYDPQTGAVLGTPIPPPAGDIEQAIASDFGPDGHLFVAGYPDYVFEYDLLSGTVLGIFAAQTSSSGTSVASELAFIPIVGDADGDWDLDLGDFAAFQACFSGDGVTPGKYNCLTFDFDRDGDVDLTDLSAFTERLTGPQ